MTPSPPSNIPVLEETSVHPKFTKCTFKRLCINSEDVIFTNTHAHAHTCTLTQRLANNIKINPLGLLKKKRN